MNFATLKGLTIPEGNVTQITDASGRVLWSSAPPFDGIVYLRPTADVSGTYSVYPTGMAGYACIDEEVADGDSTYIYSNGISADFMLTGTIPKGVTVTAGKLVCNGIYKGSNSVSGNLTISCGDVTYKSSSFGLYRSYGDHFFDIPSDMIAAINNIGGGEVSLQLNVLLVQHTSDKTTANTYLTQAYVKLTCE